MQSSRYNHIAEEIGIATSETKKEEAHLEKARDEESARAAKKEAKRRKLMESGTFQIMQKIKYLFDDCYLDGIIGFIPIIGDIVSTFTSAPFIIFSLFEIKSIPLTLAILNNYMIDMILGMLPCFVGDVIDLFHKSHRKNLNLIVDYINDKQEVINAVNKKAIRFVILLGILIYILILVIKIAASSAKWLWGLLF